MPKKNILIYGATGSIGDSTLSLIRKNRSLFNVVGITCNSNIKKVIEIANEFECHNIGIIDHSKIKENPGLKDFNLYIGVNEFSKLQNNGVDIIIYAISGSSSFHLLLDLAGCGKIIGLANKECIISLGRIFLDKAKLANTKIIPLDSEHNAIFQLIKNKKVESVRKYTITASGGNFYNYAKSDLKKITVDQAITHPKWNMGKKITVDSSTLMNKGLEIMEACILFNINSEDIDALIHPESIIHGIIEFKDRSSHAFLSQPSMEISISSVLFENNNIDLTEHELKLSKIKTLNFFEIDSDKFNSIKLAKIALNQGGLLPAIFNYSNEHMVELFLQKQILFTDIALGNEKIMSKFISDGNNIKNPIIVDIDNGFKIVDNYIKSIQSMIN